MQSQWKCDLSRGELVCAWCLDRLNQLETLGLVKNRMYHVSKEIRNDLEIKIKQGLFISDDELVEFLTEADFISPKVVDKLFFYLKQIRENERLFWQ